MHNFCNWFIAERFFKWENHLSDSLPIFFFSQTIIFIHYFSPTSVREIRAVHSHLDFTIIWSFVAEFRAPLKRSWALMLGIHFWHSPETLSSMLLMFCAVRETLYPQTPANISSSTAGSVQEFHIQYRTGLWSLTKTSSSYVVTLRKLGGRTPQKTSHSKHNC